MQTPRSENRISSVESKFGERLRDLRESIGMTQRHLAGALTEAGFTIDGPGVSRIEQGKRSIRLGEAATIAEVLDVPIVELAGTTRKAEIRRQRFSLNKAINTTIYQLGNTLLGAQMIARNLSNFPELLEEFDADEEAGPLTDPADYMKWVAVRARRIAGGADEAVVVHSDREESDALALARAICEGIVVRANDVDDDA